MNKLKEITVFVIFGMILFSVYTITKVKTDNRTTNDVFIPKNTIQYTRIESIQLFKKFVYNELFVSKDKVIFEKLKSISENQLDNETTLSNFNIDIASPIEVIKLIHNKQSYSILRMSSTSTGINGKIKIPYFEIKNEKYFLIDGDQKKLKFIKNEFNSNHTFSYKLKSRNDILIQTFDNHKTLQTTEISIHKKEIKVVVSIKQEKKPKIFKRPLLAEKGFHFSFPINDGIQIDEQLNKIPILPRISFPFKNIRHISCNYSGFKFTENDSIVGLPLIDLIVTFDRKTTIDSLLTDLVNQLKINLPTSKNQYKIGNKSLYYAQIEPNTIYLSTQNPNPKIEWSNFPTKISGDLKHLTNLENAGWKGMLIEVIPFFKSSKSLLQKTDNVTCRKINSNSFEIKFPVKKNQNLYHELLKFSLSSF